MTDRMVGWVGIALGTAGTLLAAFMFQKMDKIGRSVDRRVSELIDATSVDIDDAILERAVNCAVERDVHTAVRAATESAISQVKGELLKEVRTNVKSAYSDIRGNVLEEARKMAKAIDVGDVRSEVIEELKEAALKKLENSMDEILSGFNQELKSVQKIYSSIAKTLSPDSKETVVRIGN